MEKVLQKNSIAKPPSDGRVRTNVVCIDLLCGVLNGKCFPPPTRPLMAMAGTNAVGNNSLCSASVEKVL